MTDYTKRSLDGIWVGDCIGNLGQLYYVHDILAALENGMVKFGSQLDQFSQNFVYSDDTEEAIVLYNHLKTNGKIDQDKLAMEFATRYMERDPDGEIYGYGLNTRKVLRDIYEGVPWKEANLIIKKSEGMPSHIDSLVHSLSTGENIKDAMKSVNRSLNQQRAEQIGKVKEGSCGNGSAMRVAVLGAFLNETSDEELIRQATLQSEPTHCHSEGIAGAIAITMLANCFTRLVKALDQHGTIGTDSLTWGTDTRKYYNRLLEVVPKGQVWDGIKRASELPLNTPLAKVIEVLGNGSHVTCQDTVPLCVFLSLKALVTYKFNQMYEKAIVETSMAFGDVDTNCAIVGGIVGILSPPPEKWVKFCKQMEGVL